MRIQETERLYLREMNAADAENAFLLNLDPEVIKFTGDEAFKNIEIARKFLENYDHYKIYGFGRWAVINKSNNEFLGWCGLKYSKDKDEHDIGFRFFKRHWNKGYATEAAKKCIELGFYKFGMQKIVGRAMIENLGSIKVLEKIGLNYLKTLNLNDAQEVIYIIEKNELPQ